MRIGLAGAVIFFKKKIICIEKRDKDNTGEIQ